MDVKVDLPGVGENVQEHFYFTVTYELDFSSEFIKEILDSLSVCTLSLRVLKFDEHPQNSSLSKGYCRAGVFTFASIQQCGLAGASSVLSRAEEEVKIAKTKGIPGLAEQLDIWLETLRDDKGPDFEFALIPFFVTGADGTFSHLMLFTANVLCNSTRIDEMSRRSRCAINPSTFSWKHCMFFALLKSVHSF